MSYNWGPYFIVPSEAFEDKNYAGHIKLRENLDEELLSKEVEELGLIGNIVKITNPWYYRKKNTDTWIKIGESQDQRENFPVTWDTTVLENGRYEVLGLMHVFIKKDKAEHAIARQSVMDVNVKN
jgi:hypothetical protein